MFDDKSKKPSNTPSGALSVLWRKIIKENNLNSIMDFLIRNYIKKMDIKSLENNSIRKKNKATLVSTITSSEMTFKTFIDLLFNLLNVRRVKLTIHLEFPNGNQTEHSILVQNMDTFEQEGDLEELTKDTANVLDNNLNSINQAEETDLTKVKEDNDKRKD